MRVRVCECNISINVFFPFSFSFFLNRGHSNCFPSHANEAMGSNRKGIWTHIPVPKFIFVWQAAKPRTAKFISNLHGYYNLNIYLDYSVVGLILFYLISILVMKIILENFHYSKGIT